jgi:hypothetical protein
MEQVLGRCPFLNTPDESIINPFVAFACAQGYFLSVGEDGQPHPPANCREFKKGYADENCNQIRVREIPDFIKPSEGSPV